MLTRRLFGKLFSGSAMTLGAILNPWGWTTYVGPAVDKDMLYGIVSFYSRFNITGKAITVLDDQALYDLIHARAKAAADEMYNMCKKGAAQRDGEPVWEMIKTNNPALDPRLTT